MSGGAYNYLCFKDFETVVNCLDDLEAMRDRLRELGHDKPAAAIDYVIASIDNAKTRFYETQKYYEKLWKAVEWADSGDYRMEEIQAAINKLEKE